MRISILHFLDEEKTSHKNILLHLERSANANEHEVKVFSAEKDATTIRLSMFEYIVLIVPSSLVFGSKLPTNLSKILASSGTVLGKKAAALVVQSGFSSNKTMQNLMRAMEKEGLKIDYFNLVKNAEHAHYIGKKLG